MRVYFSVRLLWVSPFQPVHNNGSSGYGSLGSNGSHEHYISVASSSDSNGNLWEDSHREPVRRRSWTALSQAHGIADGEINRAGVLLQMSLQQICADVNGVKSWGQQGYLGSSHKIPFLGKPARGSESQRIQTVENVLKI